MHRSLIWSRCIPHSFFHSCLPFRRKEGWYKPLLAMQLCRNLASQVETNVKAMDVLDTNAYIHDGP